MRAATTNAGFFRPVSHLLIEIVDFQLSEFIFHQLSFNERMLLQLFDRNPIIFVHLHALDHEETSLHVHWLSSRRKFVATIINLGNQVLHFEAMEGRNANKHLVEHDSERPGIHLDTIAALFQQLRA